MVEGSNPSHLTNKEIEAEVGAALAAPPSADSDHSSGKICQTDGLIQKREFYQYLIRQKVDFVDMESYDFAVFGKKNHKKSRFFGIVSDKPLSEPFYKITKSTKIDYKTIISLIVND